MTPHDYMKNVVNPLRIMFSEDDRSLPLLYSVVTTTAHIPDYLAAECKAYRSDVLSKIIDECPEFKVLYSIALAQKHVSITQKNKHAHEGLSVENIKGPSVSIPIIPSKDGVRILLHKGSLLYVKNGFRVEIDGNMIDIKYIISKVLEYFDARIDDLQDSLRVSTDP